MHRSEARTVVVKGVGGPANKEVIADKNKTISQYFAEQYKCHLKCVFTFFQFTFKCDVPVQVL